MKLIVSTILLTFTMSFSSAKTTALLQAVNSNVKEIELILKNKNVLKILNGFKIIKIKNPSNHVYNLISFGGCNLTVKIHSHTNIELLEVVCTDEDQNSYVPPTSANRSAKNILMILKDTSVLKSLNGAKIVELENYSGDTYGIKYKSCLMFRTVNEYVIPCEGSVWDCPTKSVVEMPPNRSDCIKQ